MKTNLPQKIISLPSQTVQLLTLVDPGKRVSDITKELIENSIDAGPKKITIYSESGGYSAIKVVDDGCGILKDSLPDVCRYYSTSKVHNQSDMTKLEYFGFKGSSLAHFSCISKVLITTRTQYDEEATCCSYLYNVPIKSSRCKANFSRGTIVELRDLLYNYPEVRKNRKKDSLEELKILHVVFKYAFIFPSIRFLVYSNREIDSQNDSLVFDTVKPTDRQNILNLLKPQGNDQFFQIKSDSYSDAKFELYLSNFMTNFKHNIRGIYLNKRLISCPPIKAAVDAIYTKYKEKNKITNITKSPYFIMIEIPSDKIEIQRYYTSKRVTFIDQDRIIGYIRAMVEYELGFMETIKSQENISQGTAYTSTPASTISSSTQTQAPPIPINSAITKLEPQINKLSASTNTVISSVNQESLLKKDKNLTEPNISKPKNNNTEMTLPSTLRRRIISENPRPSSSLQQPTKNIAKPLVSQTQIFQQHNSSQIPNQNQPQALNSSSSSPNQQKLPQRNAIKPKSHIISKADDSNYLNSPSGSQAILQNSSSKTFRIVPVNSQSSQPQSQNMIQNQQPRRKTSPQQQPQQQPQQRIISNTQQRRQQQPPQSQFIQNQPQRQAPPQPQLAQNSIPPVYSNLSQQQQQNLQSESSLAIKKNKIKEIRSESQPQSNHQNVIQSSSLQQNQAQPQKRNDHRKRHHHIQPNQSQQQKQAQPSNPNQPQQPVQISQNPRNYNNTINRNIPIYLNQLNQISPLIQMRYSQQQPQQQQASQSSQPQQQQQQHQQQQHSLMNSRPHAQHIQNHQQRKINEGNSGIGIKSSSGTNDGSNSNANKKVKRKRPVDPDYFPK